MIKFPIMDCIEILEASNSVFGNRKLVLPGNGITLITGEMGAGKSILIKEIIYKELCKIYMGEFLSSYNRFAKGLKGNPRIPVYPSCHQKGFLGDIVGVTKPLIGFISQEGESICRECGLRMEASTLLEIIEECKRRFGGELISVGVPFNYDNRAGFLENCELFLKKGMVRGIFEGKTFQLERGVDVPVKGSGIGAVIVDTLELVEEEYEILAESITYAFEISDGRVSAHLGDNPPYYFSIKKICSKCGAMEGVSCPSKFLKSWYSGDISFLENLFLKECNFKELIMGSVNQFKSFLEADYGGGNRELLDILDWLINGELGNLSLLTPIQKMARHQKKIAQIIGWGLRRVENGIFLFDDFYLDLPDSSIGFIKSLFGKILSSDNCIVISDNSGAMKNLAHNSMVLERPESRSYAFEGEVLRCIGGRGAVVKISSDDIVSEVEKGQFITVNDPYLRFGDMLPDGLYEVLKTRTEEGRFKITALKLYKNIGVGKSSISTVGTQMGLMTEIGAIYSQLPESARRGITRRYFLYTTTEGACELCGGRGVVDIDARPFPCEECMGTRYKKTVRNILFKGFSIDQVLEMRIHEVYELFRNYPLLGKILKNFIIAGLGYINLGQDSSTLSRTEGLLLGLVKELSKEEDGRVLICDSPARGVLEKDLEGVKCLISNFRDAGGTILMRGDGGYLNSLSDKIVEISDN